MKELTPESIYQEVAGIDLADQGERAYDFAGTASSVIREMK